MTGPLVNRFKILIGTQWALFVASVYFGPLKAHSFAYSESKGVMH